MASNLTSPPAVIVNADPTLIPKSLTETSVVPEPTCKVLVPGEVVPIPTWS